MQVGSEFYDSSGNTIFSINDRSLKILGQIDLPFVDGNVFDNNLFLIDQGKGSLWYIVQTLEGSSVLGGVPQISYSSGNIYWTWPTSTRPLSRLLYGIL